MTSDAFAHAVEKSYPRWSHAHGRVTQVRQSGVLVEFDDGIQGIVRRREMAWDDTPTLELVAPGQRIEVVVVDVDYAAQRLELSRRLVEHDPWQDFVASAEPGQVVCGRVMRVMPYGAFVEISLGVVGLVHIGEIAPWYVERVEDVLWVGDQVCAEILSIDPSKRHIALSIKKHLKRLERDTKYAGHEPEMQASLGDQVGLSAAQLQRQVWGEPEPAPRKPGLKGILVVDDEEALADFMESLMDGLGYQVEAVYSGAAGVERGLRGDYDLIFMDLNMPDINGLEGARRILAERPSSRIILMTGAGLADEYRAEIEAVPFTTVLLKPFAAHEIEALLERLESGDEVEPGHAWPRSESLAAEIGFFQRVSQVVEERGTLAYALRQGLEELRAETHASTGAVFEMDPVTRSVTLLAHSGEALNFDQVKHRLSESPVKDVILEQQVVWEKDAQKRGAARFRYLLPLVYFESCIGAPIKAQGGVRHGLFLFHPTADHFTAHHLQRALAASLVMGAAIERRVVERMIRSFQRLLLVGQLSGGLAHEVNNKLASLEFHTRDLLRRFERLAREQPDMATAFAFRDAQRTAETIADMNRGVLETARMFQTLITGEEPQLVNANDIIQRTLRLLEPLARKHQVALRAQLAEGLPRTLAVGVRLQQALHNVILNAIQQIAQQQRGGRVEVTSAHKPEDAAYPIQIRIADDGPGIHRQHFDQIFALGFTTRRHEGTGLGLYITRGLVESMGGRISIAESVMLVGTTFLIELPLIAREEAPDA